LTITDTTQWIEGVAEVTEVVQHVHPTSSAPAENSSLSQSQYVDILAEEAAEIFVSFVKGASAAISYGKSQSDGNSLYEKYKSKISPTPEPSLADVPGNMEIALARFVPPMAEIFGPSLKAREKLRSLGVECTWVLRNFQNPQVKMAYQLSNTIDEDAYVLHVQEKKGFHVHITGCSDNKMLGIAIAASLIQPDEDNTENKDIKRQLLTGKRPPKPLINLMNSVTPQTLSDNTQWSHPFTFSNWTCIKSDGSVPSGMAGASHWLWPEGSPNEILKWNNQRIIVLGKAPFPRKFDPVRVFAGLNAEVRLIRIFAEDELNHLVHQIASTEEHMRQDALQTHKKWQ